MESLLSLVVLHTVHIKTAAAAGRARDAWHTPRHEAAAAARRALPADCTHPGKAPQRLQLSDYNVLRIASNFRDRSAEPTAAAAEPADAIQPTPPPPPSTFNTRITPKT